MRHITCINCGKEREIKHSTTKSNPNKYCSRNCQTEYGIKTKQLEKFNKGLIRERPTIKRILKFLYGNSCKDCGNTGEHNGKPLSLQLDHIDGNAGNNFPSNVRLLCPNCHSQTPTFTSKNKGAGRGSRGLPRS